MHGMQIAMLFYHLRPSVRPSVVTVLYLNEGTPSARSIIIVFLSPAAVQKFPGKSLRGSLKIQGSGNLRFSADIAVYLGNDTR